jgi:hypothetical protein
MDYLNKVYTRYINLLENSEILDHIVKKDQLLNIDLKLLSNHSSSSSSLSSNDSPKPLAVDVEM